MSLYINTALVGCIALIMVFTYTAELVFFADASDLGMTPTQSKLPVSKQSWIDIQWDFAYDKQYSVNTYNTKYGDMPKIKDPDKSQNILDDCQYHVIFTECKSLLITYPYPDYGFKIYSFGSDGSRKDRMSLHLTQELDDGYAIYCRNLGYNPDGTVYTKNMLESAMGFLGQIPDGVGKFFSIATFNIKQEYQKVDPTTGNIVTGEKEIIPAPVTVILNIFFIPMWIILVIEIIPALAKIIEAIGSLIPF